MDYINANWKLTDTPNVYECEKVFASAPGLIVFAGGAERAFKQIPGHHGYEGGKENLKNDLAIQKTITMLANNAVVVDKK